jgi:hypothetical protein
MFDLDITIDTADLEATLTRMETSLSPVGLSIFLIGGVLPWVKERAEMRFASEGDEVSGRWAPLETSTQEFRANGPWGVGSSHPINRRSGDLEEYITKSNSSIVTGGDSAIMYYPDTAPTGPLKEKVETAQGGKAKPKTPARPVLGLGANDLLYTMEALQFYVEHGRLK